MNVHLGPYVKRRTLFLLGNQTTRTLMKTAASLIQETICLRALAKVWPCCRFETGPSVARASADHLGHMWFPKTKAGSHEFYPRLKQPTTITQCWVTSGKMSRQSHRMMWCQCSTNTKAFKLPESFSKVLCLAFLADHDSRTNELSWHVFGIAASCNWMDLWLYTRLFSANK